MDQSMNPPQQPPVPPTPPPPSGGRFRRGLHLLGISWRVVMSEKSLLVLPLVAMFTGLLLFAGLAGIFWTTGTITRVGQASSGTNFYAQLTPVDYGLLGLYYFLAAFITVYFNAVIIAIAMKRLGGEDAKLSDGFKMANKHLGKIAGWALVTATVGLILRSLEERAGIIGRIVIGIIGLAWAIITFFVVPVLLFEANVGVFGSVKRSALLFKQRWGEQLTGTISITLLFGLLGFVAVAISVAVAFVVPVLGIFLAVASILAMTALSGAVSGVFNAALYRYAPTGQAGGGFTEGDLNGAFYAKKRFGRS
ncbi:MAG: DUF6159 family protein [Actinomycetota bacterium]